MRLPTPSAPHDAVAMPYALPMPGRSQSLLRYVSRADVLVFVMWVSSTTLTMFTWTAPLRYLAAAYVVGAMFLFARQTMPAVARAWPTLIIPVMCVISALWAPSAEDALRKGALFTLLATVAIYTATRFSGRQILAVFLLVEVVAAVLSLLKPTIIGGAWTGIFGQKNFLAMHMFILFASACAISLDKGSNRWIRLIALPMVPTAAVLILLARSGTTSILLVGCAAALIAHALLWTPASRVRHMRMLLLLGVSVIILSCVFIVFAMMQFDAMAYLLNLLGKDSTLTGRTYLWETAERVMRERPLTGVGADGFWRKELGTANSITQYFHFTTYTKFSFHNSYLENGVAFGYPGYWATVFIACWAIWSTGMNWLRNQTIINAAFLALAVMIIIRSTAETDLAAELGGTAFVLFVGAVRREAPARRPASATPPAPPAPQLQQATQ
jgi:exopolysaccharide production protein ExoQ